MLLKHRQFRSNQFLGLHHTRFYQLRYSSSALKPPNFFTANYKSQPLRLISNTYKVLGLASLITGGAAYYLLSEEKYKETTLFSGWPGKIRTIPSKAVEWTYTLDSADGPIKKTFTHLLLSGEEVEKKVKNGENKVFVNREGNHVKSWEINSLPSGDTGEDRYSTDIISKREVKDLLEGESLFWKNWWDFRTRLYPNKQGEEVLEGDGKGDLLMFSVFDGHGGPFVSDLLGRTLHGCLAWNAAKLLYNEERNKRAWEDETVGGVFNQGIGVGDGVLSEEFDPKVFSEMIATSFLAIDSHLINRTWSTLFNPIADNLPNLPPYSPAQLVPSNLFDNGSCAITTIIDVEADKLYVANVGDTRAVAGWWNPAKNEWRCDILSEDVTCENDREVARILSEHPEEERDTAVHNQGYGDTPRVLGGLQPSRAFGDDAYKIAYDDFKDIKRALDQAEPRERWRWFEECPNKTPPYVTAKPEVIVRDIHPESGDELKFIVLATDGLWDRITSEEASYLLTSHLNHSTHPDTSKIEIMATCPHSPPLPEGEHPYPKEELNMEGKWVYEDSNAATHLIRNALGGDDRELRRQFLSLRAPGVRSARDDTTAM
nr:hypothetical protein I302_02264 [Kwoniella bestiolae CBS 10118]OCF27422.1 hypothetical protein I302_02264 [Kwoniella bestiolae CBS 10118]